MFCGRRKRRIMVLRVWRYIILSVFCTVVAATGYMIRPDIAYALQRDTHRQAPARTYPQIWDVYVAYRTVNTGSANMAFPYEDTDVVIRAIVIAYFNGQKRAYTDLTGAPSSWTDGGTWHVYGTQGPDCPYALTPPWPDYRWLSDISSLFDVVHQWDTQHWGTPTFTWRKRYHHCYDKSEDGRKYDYHEAEPQSWSGWGTTNSGVNFYEPGLVRLRVAVQYGTQTKTSPDEEYATRIAVRNHNDFGVPDKVLRRDYLRWVFAYMHEPYEFGGYWFGGKTTDEGHGGSCYAGYGIDCSGLVSNGARWAGYNWDPWRWTTCGMWTWSESYPVTTVFPEDDPFGPGDVLIYHIHGDPCEGHVVSVFYRNDDNISIIEAAGGYPDDNPPGSVVRVRENRSLDDWLQKPYNDPDSNYRMFRLKAH